MKYLRQCCSDLRRFAFVARLALLSFLLCGWIPDALVVAQNANPQAIFDDESAIQRANSLQQDGKWPAALAILQEEQEQILKDGPREPGTAQRLLTLGKRQVELTRSEADPEVREKALNGARIAFTNLADVHKDRIGAVARIHLASIAMLQADPARALEQLRLCPRELLEPQEQIVLDYNIGRAFQELGDSETAATQFRAVLKSSPQFTPALDRLTELVLAAKRDGTLPDPDRILRFADELVEHGNLARAADLARALIQRYDGNWSSRPVPEAVSILCRCWSRNPAGPGTEFVEQAVIDLRKASCPDSLVNDFVRICGRELLTVDVSVIRRGRHQDLTFDPRTEESERFRRGWSQFVTSVADWYAASETPLPPVKSRNAEQAIALYLVAWGADRDNSSASVGLLSLMAPQQNLELFEKYFESLFNAIYQEKGELYVARPQTVTDWERLVRFHTVLGTLCERKGIYGDRSDARTAIGQLSLGIAREQHIRSMTDGSYPGTPELHIRLAACYQKVHQPALALDAWLTAAQLALAAEDIRTADHALQHAMPLLGEKETPEYRRWNQLTQERQTLTQPVR